MIINQIIEDCLAPIGLQIFPNVCTKKLPEYIQYNYSDERPIVYADDEDLYDLTTVQVHLFTNENPQGYKKKIRKCLRSAGFTIQSTYEEYEDDTRFNHITVEASIEGVVDDEMEEI